MAWTAGFTIEEIQDRAKKLLPPSIGAKVDEGPEPELLILTLSYGTEVVLQGAIHKMIAIPLQTDAFIEVVRKRTLEQLEKTIGEFKRNQVERMIADLGAEEYLRQKYCDSNLIYKVPRWFEIERVPGMKIRTNLDHYYLQRVRESVPHFQSFWEFIVNNEASHVNQAALLEYSHGLMIRLAQALLSADLIRELESKNHDNDVLFLENYHLTHLISMIKSIGDSLAWLTKSYYNLGGDPRQTDLLRDGFLRKICSVDGHLFESLVRSNDLIACLRLREFRNIIQHDHALHIMPILFSQSGETRVMVPVNPSNGAFGKFDFNTLLRVQDKASIASFGVKMEIVRIGDLNTPGYEKLGYFSDANLRAICHLADMIFERLGLLLRRRLVGHVTHYFPKAGVAVVSLEGDLSVGSSIIIEGETTLLELKVESIRAANDLAVQSASAGEEVAIKTTSRARAHDAVYAI